MASKILKNVGPMPPIPYISDALLNPFTTKIYTTLPREVRDMIYVYLLEDEETLERINLCAQPSIDRYPVCYSMHTAADLPPFLKTSLAHPEVVKEIITAFYEAYRGISVTSPAEIRSLLDEDFFKLGVKPKHAMLSALKVGGCLDKGYGDYVEPAKLAEQFAPLLDNEQCWAKNFQLRIRLRSRCDKSGCGKMDYVCHGTISQLAKVIKELKPISQAAEGEPRRGKVYVNVEFSVCQPRWSMTINTEHMDFSEQQWERHIDERFDWGKWYGLPLSVEEDNGVRFYER